MRVFVTGATGFVMGAVVRQLRARGDPVVALVRDPGHAAALAGIGCELTPGDLSDPSAISAALTGCDAAIHGAAIYEIGVSGKRRDEMFEANVNGTERVLAACRDARIGKAVYVSTIAAFGNTRGRVVDETYSHDGRYTSAYDETKHRAHVIAVRYQTEGLPLVIVQPGGVYGPGDHSAIGGVMRQVADGKARALAFPELGMNMVHVDDVASGVLLALDRGRPGESYVLGGEITTMRSLLRAVAEVTGQRAPSFVVPGALLRIMTLPFPRLRETVRSADGVTFWATDAKARRELGYAPRPLALGLHETYVRT
ncbi:MAG: NAD-dependent epimerase/dehydratase family protein [Chloroflexota bacterium]|nr:NAD-dependent epimerase/dehydratase family protein [Chloroflexota bacterium]